MRIDINCHGRAETITLTSDVDFVGIKLNNMISVSSDFQRRLSDSSVECDLQCKELCDGRHLTVFIYKFDGAAKVLSLKEYPGLVFCDILYEDDLRIKITV